MDSNVNKQKIREFLGKYFPNYEVKDEEDIFSLGFVNSLFAMQLVMFIEQEFNLSVENEDLELDNFRSVDAMNALIERKRSLAMAD